MTVTVFTSAVPAYADTFYCGSYKVTTGFTATKTTGICQTYSDYTCEYVNAVKFESVVSTHIAKIKGIENYKTIPRSF